MALIGGIIWWNPWERFWFWLGFVVHIYTEDISLLIRQFVVYKAEDSGRLIRVKDWLGGTSFVSPSESIPIPITSLPGNQENLIYFGGDCCNAAAKGCDIGVYSLKQDKTINGEFLNFKIDVQTSNCSRCYCFVPSFHKFMIKAVLLSTSNKVVNT